MKHFFALFLVLAVLAAGSVYFGRQFVSFSENAISAGLQANLLAARVPQLKQNVGGGEAELLFVGDIMMDRGVEAVFKKYENARYPFLKIADEISKADAAFGNLEGPISARGEDRKARYSFRFNPETVKGLNFAGFDVLSIANNHAMDWGRDALEDTVNILRENGIEPVGAGLNYFEANNPAIKEINPSASSGQGGVKIAFLAYENLNSGEWTKADRDSAGQSDFEIERVKEEINSLKSLKIADVIVVSFHWGEEYQRRSNKSQQEIGRALVEAGADLIVGHHPHVVQEIERYKNGWIAYSLGNFVFDQSFSEETMRGLMLKVKISGGEIAGVEPVEIKINDSFQPEVLNQR